MTERSTAHATFVIERFHDTSPARVFHALADPQAKRNWFDEELTVFGSEQTVAVQFPNPYVRYAPTIVRVQEMDGPAHAERNVTASYDESFRREWRHFHECVSTGVAPRTSAVDGLRDVEILRAIVRCAADRAPVALTGAN